MYVTTLLPHGKDSHNPDARWVILGSADDTRGIFEQIAAEAAESGFVREGQSNLYTRRGIEYVGYWTTMDGLNDKCR